MNYEALPDDLKDRGRFCAWRYEDRNGRRTKVPYHPLTGEAARSNDPGSFVSFSEAVQANGYDGIGIGIFNGLCAVDLDDCITDSGYIKQPAADIIHLMHSYTEVSPGGNGIHILFRADGFSYDTGRYYIMNHRSGIEVYVAGATNKYVTVTGEHFEGIRYPFGDRTKELAVLLERFMKRPEVRLLSITHDLKSDEDALTCVSRLSKEPEVKHSLFDLVSTNVPTDDFFTMSHQQTLSIMASVGTGTMIGILRNQDTLMD